MSNARIDRMLRELQSEPPVQFFQQLCGLVGLGEKAREKAEDRLPAIPAVRSAA